MYGGTGTSERATGSSDGYSHRCLRSIQRHWYGAQRQSFRLVDGNLKPSPHCSPTGSEIGFFRCFGEPDLAVAGGLQSICGNHASEWRNGRVLPRFLELCGHGEAFRVVPAVLFRGVGAAKCFAMKARLGGFSKPARKHPGPGNLRPIRNGCAGR